MKTPQPIYDAAVRFAPAVLSGAISFGEAHGILMQVVVRHFPDTIDEIGQIATDALSKRASEIECAAADTVRQWIAPLILARAPRSVLMGAARGAGQIHAYESAPYLTDAQVIRIVTDAVRDALTNRRAG